MRLVSAPLAAALALAATLMFAPAGARAADAGKVDQLMEVMDLESNVAQMGQMMSKMIQDSMMQEAAKRQFTPAQTQRMREMGEVMSKSMAEMLSWEVLKPGYSQVYQDILTNEEVDAAVAYYRSPAGASMLAKTPEIMQRSMALGQRRAQEVMPRMQAEMERVMREIADDKAPADAAD